MSGMVAVVVGVGVVPKSIAVADCEPFAQMSPFWRPLPLGWACFFLALGLRALALQCCLCLRPHWFGRCLACALTKRTNLSFDLIVSFRVSKRSVPKCDDGATFT